MNKWTILIATAFTLFGTVAYSATESRDIREYYLRFYKNFDDMPAPRGHRGRTIDTDTLGFLHHQHKLHAQPLHHSDGNDAHMVIYNNERDDRWWATLTDGGKVFISELTADEQKNLILYGIATCGAGKRRSIHLNWGKYRNDINCKTNTIASSGITDDEGNRLIDALHTFFAEGKHPNFASFFDADPSVFSMQTKAIIEAVCLYVGTLTSSGARGDTLSACGSGSAGPGGTS